jgi:hypothetical protein
MRPATRDWSRLQHAYPDIRRARTRKSRSCKSATCDRAVAARQVLQPWKKVLSEGFRVLRWTRAVRAVTPPDLPRAGESVRAPRISIGGTTFLDARNIPLRWPAANAGKFILESESRRGPLHAGDIVCTIVQRARPGRHTTAREAPPRSKTVRGRVRCSMLAVGLLPDRLPVHDPHPSSNDRTLRAAGVLVAHDSRRIRLDSEPQSHRSRQERGPCSRHLGSSRTSGRVR